MSLSQVLIPGNVAEDHRFLVISLEELRRELEARVGTVFPQEE